MGNQNCGLQEVLSPGNLPSVAYTKKRGGGITMPKSNVMVLLSCWATGFDDVEPLALT